MLSSGLNAWSTQQMHAIKAKKQTNKQTDKSDMQYWDCLSYNWNDLPYSLQTNHLTNTTVFYKEPIATCFSI